MEREVPAFASLCHTSNGSRCWRLQYADDVNFHLDTLPCVPEDSELVRSLAAAGVTQDWAARAVMITDRIHADYRVLSRRWTSSNPRGFARWFESRAALGRSRAFAENRLRASIEDVPP
jgi:hypothetical protein